MHTTASTSPLRRSACSLTAALLLAVFAAPALADKPDGAGGGKGSGKYEHKHDHKDKDKGGNKGRDEDRGGSDGRALRDGRWFGVQERQVLWGYYGPQVQGGGKCPPGLAKKGNGCMPPGQARKYAVGRPLPADVVFYPVPQPVLVQLPPVPAGHKYVRVAADILLIAIGTSMVVDAVTDLGRL